MATYYLVKVANEATFEVRNWGGQKDMLLVHDRPVLPSSRKGLVMLHEKHANRGCPMVYDEGAGVFTCIHCAESINMSEALFQKILMVLTLEKYCSVQVPGEAAKVTIVHPVDVFPVKLPDPGHYAVKCEEVEEN